MFARNWHPVSWGRWQVFSYAHLGTPAVFGRWTKVAIHLPGLAGLTTLFFVDQTCKRWQVNSQLFNLQTLAGEQPLFGLDLLLTLNLQTLAGVWPLFGFRQFPQNVLATQPANRSRWTATFRIWKVYLQTVAGERPLFGFDYFLVINLHTLAGERPLFGFGQKWPLTCQG